MPRQGRKASTLLLIALVTLAATLTVLSPVLAQGEQTRAGEEIPADVTPRFHTVRSQETGCPEGKDPCWDLTTFAVLPGDWVELHADISSGGGHNVAIEAPIDLKTPVEVSGVQVVTFQVPETFKADGIIEFICDVHPTTMVASFVGPAALSAGEAHEDVPEMGVHFLAYWVGVIAFALIFIVYGATFFLFKYNETSATTDHLDRSKGEGARLETRNAMILAVLFAVVATAALIYVLS